MIGRDLKTLLENLVSQMAMQKQKGFNPKIRVNRGTVSFSSDAMAEQRFDLSDQQLEFLRNLASQKGLKV